MKSGDIINKTVNCQMKNAQTLNNYFCFFNLKKTVTDSFIANSQMEKEAIARWSVRVFFIHFLASSDRSLVALCDQIQVCVSSRIIFSVKLPGFIIDYRFG